MKFTKLLRVCFALAPLAIASGAGAQQPARMTNSIGMELVRVPAGAFTMGETNLVPLAMHKDMPWLTRGDWDEHPARRVTISKPFYIGAAEVTIEQYRQFDPKFTGTGSNSPYVSGISWYDAQRFVQWLSKKEGRTYRLPTEAEWEYAARAGTNTLFWSGSAPPAGDAANAWGLRNVHSGVAEWVADWHGAYPHNDETDPVGPATGLARVIRGGGLDRDSAYYARAANRASIGPDFPPAGSRARAERLAAATDTAATRKNEKPAALAQQHLYQAFVRDVLGNEGNHDIGLRVVLADAPATKPRAEEMPFFRQAVKTAAVKPAQITAPYFRKRRLLPIPPENTPVEQLAALQIAGLHPALLRHQHSPAVEVTPNGDVFAVYYTSVSELTPDVAMLATRLRYGADEWDMPDLFLDFADIDDHAPMLWQDGDSLRFYFGANKMASGFPFQWTSSGDNGATWSEIQYPLFQTRIGPHSAQPITSAFRDASNAMYVGSDAIGPESVLWVSKDNGKSWIDTGGRTGGRHTAFAPISGNRILGMGGKSSDIEGFMPKSISSDGGATWQISKTPFTSLGSNQRPSLVKLASGRLFFAGDLQRVDGLQPKGVTQRGAYVALSNDDGESWIIKRLPGAEEHEEAGKRATLKGGTIGYSVANQGPDGLIHLITSMNDQALHFALNEAWIMAADAPTDTGVTVRATSISNIRKHEQRAANGKVAGSWSFGSDAAGAALLHGAESWTYPNGRKQYQVKYERGRRVGTETFWRDDGSVEWTREHRADGSTLWTRYWPNGRKRMESTWRDMRAEGAATSWDMNGKVTGRAMFTNGVPKVEE